MVLFLHVGQGGNAVGACFWQHAARERGPRRWLLDASGRCRCVLVDTEPKAVHAAVHVALVSVCAWLLRATLVPWLTGTLAVTDGDGMHDEPEDVDNAADVAHYTALAGEDAIQ